MFGLVWLTYNMGNIYEWTAAETVETVSAAQPCKQRNYTFALSGLFLKPTLSNCKEKSG